MTDHYLLYEPISDTLQFDARGAGPTLDALQVIANTHPGAAHPVQLRTGELASAGLTLEQSALLRGRLLAAENDVRAATVRERRPLTATGAEGCCEECRRAVRSGEPIVVEDEGTEDRVVLHVGRCPGAKGRN